MEKQKSASSAIHPVIAALEKAGEAAVSIRGYRGTSDAATLRVYQSLDTSAYIEIPREAVVYLEAESDEPGAIRIFVRASSEIRTVRRDRMPTADRAQEDVWALSPRLSPPRLPPPQPVPTFWTCAGGCEGVFMNRAIQIHEDEARCLLEPNAQRQEVCRAQVEQRKFEAKRALYFCLSACINTHGAPPFMTVPDPSPPSGYRVERFSLGAYHTMLVARHLEKPE